MSTSDKIKELLKYIKYYDQESCLSNKGIYKKLSKTEIKNIIETNNRFNILYLTYSNKLMIQYKESLRSLIEILKILQNNIIISNEELNEIADKTQNILINMYKSCQTNYISAALAFINISLLLLINPKNQSDLVLLEKLSKK